MSNKELINIQGGASSGISGTVLNAISRLINTLLDLGRAVGSAIRRYTSGNSC